jgi:hypothetical protein
MFEKRCRVLLVGHQISTSDALGIGTKADVLLQRRGAKRSAAADSPVNGPSSAWTIHGHR